MAHNLLVKIRELVRREAGQDMVEYALVIALIAFGATAGMRKVASGISTAYSNMSSLLTSAL
jgi:pilus assembly protein Flp/PilA